MFGIRRLENSPVGGRFYRLRATIEPNSPYDFIYFYGKKGEPPKRFRMKSKTYFKWNDKRWETFLRSNLGRGSFYCYYAGGFFVSGYIIRRKGKKVKIRKRMKGNIIRLFMGYVS